MIGTIRSIHLPNDVNRMLNDLKEYDRKVTNSKTSASLILTNLVKDEYEKKKEAILENKMISAPIQQNQQEDLDEESVFVH